MVVLDAGDWDFNDLFIATTLIVLIFTVFAMPNHVEVLDLQVNAAALATFLRLELLRIMHPRALLARHLDRHHDALFLLAIGCRDRLSRLLFVWKEEFLLHSASIDCFGDSLG